MARHVVAPVDDIPPGGRKLVQVNGRAVVVFNLGGEFFALNNRCPHRGGSLCDGVAVGLVQSSEPGDYQYSPQGRDHPLPVALVGVRHPHRAILVRSGQAAHAQIRRVGRAGREAGRRAVQGRDVSGQRRGEVRGGGGVSAAEPREVYFEFTAIGDEREGRGDRCRDRHRGQRHRAGERRAIRPGAAGARQAQGAARTRGRIVSYASTASHSISSRKSGRGRA